MCRGSTAFGASSGVSSTAGPRTCTHESDGSTILARGGFQRRFPRLQGLARRRARDPRTPARRRSHGRPAGRACGRGRDQQLLCHERGAREEPKPRRAGQGHREIVLAGINLGCFRDRGAGYDLPRLVREAGATPGLARLRLSSIEINHVNDALVDALRETSTVARHLHVPLQSGDDGVLRAMRRRYTTATYLKKLEPLVADFNLTSDVIVGFPTEDDAAFERTLATVERAGLSRVHVFPYSPRPGTVTAGDDRVGPAVKKERGARLRELSNKLERRRWETKLGRRDTVLVDRPGRGYGDDYTPFLVEAPVGELIEVRAEALAAEGIRAVAA